MAGIWCAHAWLREGEDRDVWRSRVRFEVSPDGQIERVELGAEPRPDDHRLEGIVIPGMPNLHGHAFQRLLAGRVEHGSRGASDSFWTWREGMYGLASRVDAPALQAISAMLYVEALEAGYTRMGEFHYLHHGGEGLALEMSRAVLAGANTAGLPLTLLPVAYLLGGFGRPPSHRQQRFTFHDVQGYLRFLDELRGEVEGPHLLGVAPHSLRAVSVPALQDLVGGAREMLGAEVPLHIHIAEQPAEVQDCRAATGSRPIRLLLETVHVDRHWCLVHATHADATEITEVAASGAVVGLCPTTEANLGDGHFPLGAYLASGLRFGVGSDSHATVDPAEEVRWLEYQARLASGRRVVLEGRGEDNRLGEVWGRAVSGGSQALGIPSGLRVGARADLVALDAEHPRLLGASTPAEKLDAWLLGSAPGAVSTVMTGARLVVQGGRHVARDAVQEAFRMEVARIAAIDEASS